MKTLTNSTISHQFNIRSTKTQKNQNPNPKCLRTDTYYIFSYQSKNTPKLRWHEYKKSKYKIQPSTNNHHPINKKRKILKIKNKSHTLIANLPQFIAYKIKQINQILNSNKSIASHRQSNNLEPITLCLTKTKKKPKITKK